jgi:hypothetical protein
MNSSTSSLCPPRKAPRTFPPPFNLPIHPNQHPLLTSQITHTLLPPRNTTSVWNSTSISTPPCPQPTPSQHRIGWEASSADAADLGAVPDNEECIRRQSSLFERAARDHIRVQGSRPMQLPRSSDVWGGEIWELIFSLVSIEEGSIEIPVSERAVPSL